MRTQSIPLLATAACAAISISSLAGAQINSQWAAAVSDNWNVASRWTPVGVPGNTISESYNVTLPDFGSTYTVTLDSTRTVSKLDLLSTNAAGQKTVLDLGGNTLSTLGSFTLTGGELRGSDDLGVLEVDGLATFTNGTVLGADLVTSGEVLFAGDDAEEFCDTGFDHNGSSVTWSGECDIFFDGGTTFNLNNSDSVFLISHLNDHELSGSIAESFNNFGTIIKEVGEGVTTFDRVTFNNSGEVKVRTGELKFIEGGLIVAGVLFGAQFEVNADATLRMVNDSGADIAIQTLDADVTLDGASSAFSSLSTLRSVSTGGSLTLRNGRVFATAGALLNSGQVTVSQGARLEISSGGSLASRNVGTISVQENGQLNVRNGAQFEVSGTLLADGGSVNFNTGAVLLNVQGNSLNNGVFIAQNGGVIRAPQLGAVDRINSRVSIIGASSDLVDGGGASILPGISSIAPLGTLALDGRNVTFQNNFVVEGSGSAEGRLVVEAGTVVQVAPGRTLLNFLDGVLDRGRFVIRGELVADNLEIIEIGSGIEIDSDRGIIRNRTTGLDSFRSLRTIRSTADVRIANGRDLITVGNLEARPGSTLNVGQPDGQNSTTVRVAGDLSANGLIRLNGGEIITSGSLILGGRIEGSGRINGRVVNNGSFAPGFSPGRAVIDGDFLQGALGEIVMEIAGPEQGINYDSLIINGAMGFEGGRDSGLLSIVLLDGYVPEDGQTFDLITYTRLIGGSFANITFAGLPSGASFDVNYGSDRLSATFRIPAPGAFGLLCAGGLAALRRRRVR